ncbi:unnamed protein product [Dicrocoelium dendriticum]|nr:unnamed protein product [Dicrocoelium dendriticum]
MISPLIFHFQAERELQKRITQPTELQEARPPTVAQRRYLPAPGQPIPHGWVCVEDDFWTVAVLNHSHISHDAILFNDAKFNDGQMRLIMINSKCTRLLLLADGVREIEFQETHGILR